MLFSCCSREATSPLAVSLLAAIAVVSTCTVQALPASDAFSQWVAQHGEVSQISSNDFATGLELGRSRAEEMRGLLESDPEQFVRKAMPASVRDSLPAAIQQHVERRIKGRGSFRVYCGGLPGDPEAAGKNRKNGDYGFEVRLNGADYHGFVFGKWRDQISVDDAEIDGVVLGDAIAIGDSPTPGEQDAAGQQVTASSPTTTGPNTLLYMIARFSDQTNDPISDATVLSQMAVISNFWMNCSGGSVYIHGLAVPTQVVDIVHITLPQPSSYGSSYNNNFAQLLSDARSAASAQGYNYSSYNLDVVVTTSGGFSYAGRSYIGAQGSHWVTPYTTLRTGGHELGHNLGLYHANYWRTDSTLPFGKDTIGTNGAAGYVADNSNGEWVEYGHYFSVMSAQYGGEWDDAAKPIYSPAEKVRLGWLTGNEVQYISASGTYRLFRHDARDTVGTPRAIRIETAATDYTGYARRYWLQYRYAPWSTAQSWYQNGIEIDVCQTSYGSDGSIQLDMTPYSRDQSSPFYDASSPPGNWWTIDNSDKLDGALIIGRTYDDVNAGIHVTPIAAGNNGAGEEYIDVVINLGSAAANHPPVINSFTVTTNRIGTGQSVNFTVSASDPDGDPLAYSWDFDQSQVWTASGLNSSNATTSWPSAGQYRVVVQVSDMKGGKATASQIITVGAPANIAEIWGRVVWGGQPVYGARISTTSGAQAWTETDGTYVLTDLTPGSSYVVNCQAAGLTFTPQFSNPVSLASTNIYGVDFYANEPLVGGNGTTYTISGQVTDGSSGVAGVEVRGGGMVAITDSGGNFQLPNFVNGGYTLTPRFNNWIFSPATRVVIINSANSSGNNFARSGSYSISGQFSGLPTGGQSPAPTVYLSNGRSVVATKTGSGPTKYWAYSLSNLPAGQYSLGAELSGYNIVPSGFSNPLTINGNMSGMNFSASAAAVAGAVSGKVTQQGAPVSGVNVQINQSGSTIATTTTDSDGSYRFENLASGSYTLLPAKSGYTFSPASLAVSFVPSSGNNFTAAGPTAPPVINFVTASPTNVPGTESTTTLIAAASGSGTLTYSWDAIVAAGPVVFTVNDSSSAASTTVSFQLPGSYTFRVRVTDASGLSATANVAVTVAAGAGSMAVAPYEVQVAGGQSVTFRADAWDQLGNRISVTPVWSVDGGGSIDVNGVFTGYTMGGPYHVSALAGTLTATGLVWVTSTASGMPPSITTQPLSRAVCAGSNVTFSVSASGTTPLAYQWRLGLANIAGATGSSYTVTNAQSADAGAYSVVVSNTITAVVSDSANLTVNDPPMLTPITDRVIHAGSSIVISNSASDIDLPPQTLMFSLGTNAPAGATIGATSGLFVWNTTAAQANSTNSVTIQVTDNGTPALSDARGFVIRVIPSLTVSSIMVSNAAVRLIWNAASGATYQVQYKNDLSQSQWTAIASNVIAGGPVAFFDDALAPASRFYRVAVVHY